MTKNHNFFRKSLCEWKQIRQFQQYGWIFRGQRNSQRGLKTTLERACENYAVSLQQKGNIIEKATIREFKRKFHHYSQYIPAKDDTLEWLSLMQHYGGPTRLLDFTYSIYIAAYFALENQLAQDEVDKGYAIWAINANWAIDQSAKKYAEGSDQYRFLKKIIQGGEEEASFFECTFRKNNSKLLACPQNPFTLNERLTIQKGVFMCPGNVTSSFEDNLCSLPGWEERENVLEMIIPERMRREALDWLYDMNISRATLFPGLDGFAQSLMVSPPKGWDDKS